MSAPAEKKAGEEPGKKSFKLIEKSGMDLEALEVEGEEGEAAAAGAGAQEAAAPAEGVSAGEKREIQEREANR